MPQCQLPLFASGVTNITPELAFEKRDGSVYYFNGQLPVFSHAQDDLATFRLFSSQLVINGTATQVEIAKAFGVPLGTVKRYVKLYRTQGPKGFYAPRRARSASKLTAAVRAQVQAGLDEGLSVPEAARQVGLLPDTVHKAIRSGRLHRGIKKKAVRAAPMR
jgi:transposase-like protein